MASSAPTEMTTSAGSPPAQAPRRLKRLVFDGRYGWIVDEWTDPSEEALSGGRGMFCIVPIAKGAAKAALQSVDIAAQTAIRILEDPRQFSLLSLKANLNAELHKLLNLIQMPKFPSFANYSDSNRLLPPP